MTLVEFLEARIAEEEAGAHAAGGQDWYLVLVPPPAMRRTPDEETHWSVDSPASLVSYEVTSRGKAGHIADWSPARVLADCKAKRAVMDCIFAYEYKIDGEWACCHSAGEIRAGECEATPVDEIEALRALALPYADHPDYQKKWKEEL